MEVLPFGIKVINENGVQTVYLTGELDYLASLELTPQLDKIATTCHSELLFDLGNVTFIDSEAIKMLLRAFEFAGSARMVRCSNRARRVIKLAGAEKIFHLTDIESPSKSACC